MNIAQALKQKNRLAGEISRLRNILTRENCRRNDNTSKVNVEEIFNSLNKTSEELGQLKGKIAVANVAIYPLLERMAEYKGLIAYYTSIPKRNDIEVEFIGR